MTSVGGQAEKSTVRSCDFLVDAVLKPINLKDAMRELEASYGPRTEPFFDLSPRGLYVNWFRRNADSKQRLPNRTSSAMTYSFDFVRVLQNYRNRRPGARFADSGQEEVIMNFPPYPFRMQKCNPVPKAFLVRAKEVPQKKAGSVYNRRTCLESVFENLEDVVSSQVDASECIGIELASSGDAIWNALWGPTSDEKQQRVIKDFQTPGMLFDTLSQTNADKTILIVVGPLKGTTKKNGFNDAFSMEAPYEFIEKFQEQVAKSDSSVSGMLFVSGDASHAGFEFVSAFFASLRFKVRRPSFVSMLRLSEGVGGSMSEVLCSDTVLTALNAAASGESILQLTDQGDVQGCRIVPKARPLSWKTDWVKVDCLYVVTGALSAIATTFLPTLAEIGVRHFLFLTHHREPSDSFVKKLRERGAKSILSERCNIAEVPSIRSAIQKGLVASGAVRVAGVFHLAGIADDTFSIPLPTDQIKRVMNVKYEGQRALLQAIDLLDGDIFCVPGSISSIVGSPGVAYSASQNACRALQVHASTRLMAPFPILGISDSSINNSILGDIEELKKRARRNGISTTASQVFDLAMMHQDTVPTEAKDVILLRANAQILDEYMNATGQNKLFGNFSQLEEDLRTTSIDDILATATSGTNHYEPKVQANLNETAEDVLISVIAEVTGLTEDEVRQSATPEAELDEAFSIDSITSLRLGKHLERMGYKFSMESFLGANFGSLVEQMNKDPPQVLEETTSDEDQGGVELTDKELPISEELMKKVGGGHDMAIGGIVPSLWYGLVGALVLKTNVKAVLYRMALMDTDSAKVMKKTEGSRTALTFHTSTNGKEPLIRAQVTSTDKTIEKVPLITGEKPVYSFDNMSGMMRQSGFSYRGPYQSLRRIDVFRVDSNQPDEKNFASCWQVQAEAQVDLPEDPELEMAQAFFVSVDASFQVLFAGFGTMLAPASFYLERFESIENWPHVLRQNGGKVNIVCRYLKATATGVEGISTAYCGNRPVSNGRCTAKAIPAAIGSRCYPEFFFTPPRHVLLCFHGVAGTSSDYDALADLMAPHGVRVLSVELPLQGRRLMQTDDELFSTLDGLKKDLMPWLNQMLRAPDGRRTMPYSIVAMSGGGVCAYGLLRDCLISAGLVPRAFITIASQPPHVPNMHIERTCHLSVENVMACLCYYAIVARFDGSGFAEMPLQMAVDRLNCILGPVHELTTENRSDKKPLNVPAYIFGMKTDPIVDWKVMGAWRAVFTRSAWRRGHGRIGRLNNDFNHFFSLNGQAEQVFQQVFFEYGVLENILRKNPIPPKVGLDDVLRKPPEAEVKLEKRLLRLLTRVRRSRRRVSTSVDSDSPTSSESRDDAPIHVDQ